ncbi:MAG TPA: amidase family protein [Stellaceae bacterium]|jgi:aspartyl-tRNA(Asn)/glutamyl-tRNA(Gln) amidotransferase subunit A|nr:amidase family protein [Stellaceae bacterium]
MTDLAYTSAVNLAGLIARRSVSPVDIIDDLLHRIEASQPTLNAFITICADEARAAAREAEAAVMRGDTLGPLHGVPFAAKDLVNTAGVRTTFGSIALASNVPATDSPSVARLKAAGAILVGKTTTPEFGHKCFTEAPLFGRTANPWDLSRTCGGSSGGAAAAVAAGLGPIGIGTDGGGSSRIPASCCGIVGFKQTLGLVPHDLTPDGFGNQSHITPMTRTVADAALMLHAMAGPDPCDPHALGLDPPDFVDGARPRGDLKGVRIAWRPLLGNTVLAGDVRAACEAALAAFEELGAIVEPVADDFASTEPVWLVLTQSFWNARFRRYVAQYGNQMSDTLLRQMDNGAGHSAVALQEAMFERTRIFREVQGWFRHCDIVATPTLSRTALPIGHDFFTAIEIDGQVTDTVRNAWYPYTLPFNLSANPAVTLPCGFGADGLPIGLQLVGPRLGDATLLRAAALFEAVRPWAGHHLPAPTG